MAVTVASLFVTPFRTGASSHPGVENANTYWKGLQTPHTTAPSISTSRYILNAIFYLLMEAPFIGTVAVQNISFPKLVVVRFILDDWKIASETLAIYSKYSKALSNYGCDKSSFVPSKRSYSCVRYYSVYGRDYWDNNDIMNDHIESASYGKNSATSNSRVEGSKTVVSHS